MSKEPIFGQLWNFCWIITPPTLTHSSQLQVGSKLKLTPAVVAPAATSGASRCDGVSTPFLFLLSCTRCVEINFYYICFYAALLVAGLSSCSLGRFVPVSRALAFISVAGKIDDSTTQPSNHPPSATCLLWRAEHHVALHRSIFAGKLWVSSQWQFWRSL